MSFTTSAGQDTESALCRVPLEITEMQGGWAELTVRFTTFSTFRCPHSAPKSIHPKGRTSRTRSRKLRFNSRSQKRRCRNTGRGRENSGLTKFRWGNNSCVLCFPPKLPSPTFGQRGLQDRKDNIVKEQRRRAALPVRICKSCLGKYHNIVAHDNISQSGERA